MTNHSGNISGELVYLATFPGLQTPSPPTDKGLEAFLLCFSFVGFCLNVLPTRNQVSYQGNISNCLFSSFANNFWLIPEQIDCGLLVEDQFFDIYLWNSGNEPVIVSQILGINTDGTQLLYPSVPLVFGSGAYQQHSLTVFGVGSPVQRTSYQYLDGEFNKILSIIGQRVVFFPYEPNIGNGITLKYSFNSIIYRTKKMYEQRRALSTRPKISEKFGLLLEGMEAQKFRNSIRFLHKNVIACPLFADFLRLSTNILVDDVTLHFEDVIEDYYSMRQDNPYSAQYVLIINRNDIYQQELKRILEFGTNSITVVEPITSSFDRNETSVYPCFVGVLSSCEVQNINKNVLTANITLEEIFLGDLV